MFNQFARRLASSLGSARTATMPIATSSSMCHGSQGCIPLLGRPWAEMPSMSLGRGIWTGSPRQITIGALSRSLIPNCRPPHMSPSCPPSSSAPLAGSISAQQVRGFASKKHKRVIRQSKGFRGRANRCFRIAIRRLEKSWQYAYRDRKNKKREFRKLWIQRLNAGVRQYGMSYSRFINMQGKSGVVLDRKILSGLAMYEPFSFKAVVDVVKMNAAAGAEK